ncbi:hypothetical protein CWB96_11745 [Pseudoalteromonas citrea]|uniref:Carrier domain-containing protein n=1 Tax=Pseudoalteromonas citrea TaxID=43655 RepID=A0A5S3XNF6_9GAMM|nr:non-ribosomal peptide synthetase [Pseudoalteromonas citrea]TMP43898.1 hypothetical protein CWB97_07745 [Pseudoalteromonas citrea]TMP58543.1 hypothetical protein CWB96_11745 [Pseudoalteromonas citrea]
MNISEIVKTAIASNVYLYVEESKLKFKAPKAALTEQLKRQISENKTEIIKYLRNEKNNNAFDIVNCDEGSRTPLSNTQKRFWLVDQMSGGSAHYNMPSAALLKGDVNIESAEFAMNEVIARHEILRTVYHHDGGEPYQVVLEKGSLKIHEVIATDLTINDVDKLIERKLDYTFDLAKELPIKCYCIQTQRGMVLLINIHHIAADGWSSRVLVKDFCHFYAQAQGQQLNLVEHLPFQYADYAFSQNKWLQSADYKKQLEYWTDTLSGAPEYHSLPLDRSRPVTPTYSGSSIHNQITTQTLDKFKRLCRSQGASLFMGLHSVLATLMYQFGRENDIVVGTPIANRDSADIAGLVGAFINTLALRTQIDPHADFKQVIEVCKKSFLQAYDNRSAPFEEIIEQLDIERSDSPLFQVMLSLQGEEQHDLTLSNVEVLPYELPIKHAKYELLLNVVEKQGLALEWEYQTDVFSPGTIKRFADAFAQIINQVVENSSIPISKMRVGSSEEHLFLSQGSSHSVPLIEADIQGTLHDMFLIQAQKTPHAIAVYTNSEQLTFTQLSNSVRGFAQHLINDYQLTAGHGVVVNVGRSAHAIQAMLAVMLCGGYYIPVDPTYPEERIQHILKDSQATLIIDETDAGELRVSTQDKQIQQVLDLSNFLDDVSTHSFPRVTGKHAAYVIYTSGTTGLPKGVRVSHEAITTSTYARLAYYSQRNIRSYLSLSSFAFDSSIAGIFWTLSSGAQLVIPERLDDLGLIVKLIEDAEVDSLLTVPSFYHEILLQISKREQFSSELTTVILAGEALTSDVISKHADVLGSTCALFNEYGPTEASVWSAVQEIDCAQQYASVPIGKSPGANSLLVMDNDAIVPFGAVGELHIGGTTLADGYHNNKTLTDEKFIHYEHPDSGKVERLYKTGDLVKYNQAQELVFIGRNDNQCKLRGLRIELAEVEMQLVQHSIAESSKVLVAQVGGTEQLVAFLQTTMEVDTGALKQKLNRYLPNYMIPNYICTIDAWPKTPNGKIDIPHLMRVLKSDKRKVVISATQGTELAVAEVFVEILEMDVEHIDVTTHFMELGGNSLKLMRLKTAIEEKFNLSFEAKGLVEEASVRAISAIIEQHKLQQTIKATSQENVEEVEF